MIVGDSELAWLDLKEDLKNYGWTKELFGP